MNSAERGEANIANMISRDRGYDAEVNDFDGQIPSAAELRVLVLQELGRLGFRATARELQPIRSDKLFHRGLHRAAREIALEDAKGWLAYAWPRYRKYFADGEDVSPKAIAPVLVEAQTDEEKELFRLARYTWSLPYTKGFGRRLQFLLFDSSSEKLIGILGLQSPPLSLPARDELFSYPPGMKTEKVNQTMDIYTLGALPPYARLLGAKLVALAAGSNSVREAYTRKYKGRRTEMKGRQLPAHLIALTTTSAYGRSSILNRLQYRDDLRFQSLGYSEGYGAFHLERLYPLFRRFLEAEGVSTRGGFGRGPRIKWQTMVRALERIGFSRELLKHRVRREVFLIPLVENLKAYMAHSDIVPQPIDVTFEEMAQYWRTRWLLPRSERVDGWYAWDHEQLRHQLFVWQRETHK